MAKAEFLKKKTDVMPPPSRAFDGQYAQDEEVERKYFPLKPRTAGDVTESPAFKAWFGKSKVVDDDGKPMPVYHGTDSEFDTFEVERAGTRQNSDWGPGIYLTPRHSNADYYRVESVKKMDEEVQAAFARYEELEKTTKSVNGTPQYSAETRQALKDFQSISSKLNATTKGQVLTLYAKIENPWVEEYRSSTDPWLVERAKERGYDGIFIMAGGGGIDEIVAFYPNQVKSVDNGGKFDSKDNRITASAATGLLDWRKPTDGQTLSLADIEAGDADAAAKIEQYLRMHLWQDPKEYKGKQVKVWWLPLDYFEHEFVAGDPRPKEHVSAIAQAMKDGKPFAPAVFHEKTWVDGNHRIKAARELGLKKIPAVFLEDFAHGSAGSTATGYIEQRDKRESAAAERNRKDMDRVMAEMDEMYAELGGEKTAAPLHEEAKAKTYYHGTMHKSNAESIMTKGIQPRELAMPQWANDKRQLAPAKGRIYLASNPGLAAFHAMGLGLLGKGKEQVQQTLTSIQRYNKEFTYGYIFEIKGTDVTGDVVADEDDIGKAVTRALTAASDMPPDVKRDLIESATQVMTPRQKLKIMEGKIEGQAVVGKKLQKKLKPATMQWLLDNGAHLAHEGTVFPSRAWRFKREDAAGTHQDEIMSICEEIPLTQPKTATVPEPHPVIKDEGIGQAPGDKTEVGYSINWQGITSAQRKQAADAQMLAWWVSYLKNTRFKTEAELRRFIARTADVKKISLTAEDIKDWPVSRDRQGFKLGEKEKVQRKRGFDWNNVDVEENDEEHITTNGTVDAFDFKGLGQVKFVPMKSIEPTESGEDEDKVLLIVEGLKSSEAFFTAILIDTDGNIYDGHHRYKALQVMGVKTVPVQVLYTVDDAKVAKQATTEGVHGILFHGSSKKIMRPSHTRGLFLSESREDARNYGEYIHNFQVDATTVIFGSGEHVSERTAAGLLLPAVEAGVLPATDTTLSDAWVHDAYDENGLIYPIANLLPVQRNLRNAGYDAAWVSEAGGNSPRSLLVLNRTCIRELGMSVASKQAAGVTDTPAFKSWFKGSKIVDAQGQPLKMYHGTGADITEFSYDFTGTGRNSLGRGFYFTTDPDAASGYANERGQSDMPKPGGEQANILPVYLAMKKPISPETTGKVSPAKLRSIILKAPDLDAALENWGDVAFEGRSKVLANAMENYVGDQSESILQTLMLISTDFFPDHPEEFYAAVRDTLGYDGVMSGDANAAICVAWFPGQIKSAIGNGGGFDPKDRKITAGMSNTPTVDTPAFKSWFGDSKILDDEGHPLVMYHGTKASFEEFDIQHFGQTDPGWMGHGFYFTASEHYASDYATVDYADENSGSDKPATGANVMPVYLRVLNPYILEDGEVNHMRADRPEEAMTVSEEIRAKGYDGIVYHGGNNFREVVVFERNQIKSALGNNGSFDPKNNRITAKLAAPKDDLTAFMKDLYAQTSANPFNHRERVFEDAVGIECSPFNGMIHLSAIRTFEPGQGNATKALQMLTGLADKHGVMIDLDPKPFGNKGLSKQQLKAWYGRHGFNVEGPDTMVYGKKPTKLMLTDDNMMEIPMDQGDKLDPSPVKLRGFTRQHSKAAFLRTSSGPVDLDKTLPPEPGESPIPAGTIRCYHYTDTVASAESINRLGLKKQFAQGDDNTGQGPTAAVWAATIYPKDAAYGHPVIEFWVKPEEISNTAQYWMRGDDPIAWAAEGKHSLVMNGDIPRNQIVAIHMPWNDVARSLLDSDPAYVQELIEQELPEFEKNSGFWREMKALIWYRDYYRPTR